MRRGYWQDADIITTETDGTETEVNAGETVKSLFKRFNRAQRFASKLRKSQVQGNGDTQGPRTPRRGTSSALITAILGKIRMDADNVLEIRALVKTNDGNEVAGVEAFVGGLEADLADARAQLVEQGYEVGFPADTE